MIAGRYGLLSRVVTAKLASDVTFDHALFFSPPPQKRKEGPPDRRLPLTWQDYHKNSTSVRLYVVYKVCEASLQASEVTEKDWMNIPGGSIWEVWKLNYKFGRSLFDPVGEMRHDKANFACFADILNLLRILIRRRTTVWLAYSRRSDSRAWEKNSRREKNEGRLERESGREP